jgi:ATP-dependent DNA ligase
MSLRERTRPRLGIIEPCLPSPAKAPPSGSGWLHEIKHDGFRIMARRNGVSKRLGSSYRSGRSPHWVKIKNPKAPAVTREAEEDWGSKRRSRARR